MRRMQRTRMVGADDDCRRSRLRRALGGGAQGRRGARGWCRPGDDGTAVGAQECLLHVNSLSYLRLRRRRVSVRCPEGVSVRERFVIRGLGAQGPWGSGRATCHFLGSAAGVGRRIKSRDEIGRTDSVHIPLAPEVGRGANQPGRGVRIAFAIAWRAHHSARARRPPPLLPPRASPSPSIALEWSRPARYGARAWGCPPRKRPPSAAPAPKALKPSMIRTVSGAARRSAKKGGRAVRGRGVASPRTALIIFQVSKEVINYEVDVVPSHFAQKVGRRHRVPKLDAAPSPPKRKSVPAFSGASRN
jgi:hypothetical protein